MSALLSSKLPHRRFQLWLTLDPRGSYRLETIVDFLTWDLLDTLASPIRRVREPGLQESRISEGRAQGAHFFFRRGELREPPSSSAPDIR